MTSSRRGRETGACARCGYAVGTAPVAVLVAAKLERETVLCGPCRGDVFRFLGMLLTKDEGQ